MQRYMRDTKFKLSGIELIGAIRADHPAI